MLEPCHKWLLVPHYELEKCFILESHDLSNTNYEKGQSVCRKRSELSFNILFSTASGQQYTYDLCKQVTVK